MHPSVEWLDDPSTPAPVLRRPPLTARLRTRSAMWCAVVAVLAAAIAGAVVVLRGPAPLHVTVSGTAVDRPGDTIHAADLQLADYARTAHAAVGHSSRCYYDEIGANPTTDVAPALQCGPVLLYDSTATTAWLSVPFDTTRAGNGHLRLTTRMQRFPLSTTGLPADSHLVRPDHRHAPKGVAGLHVPVPPPAPADLLAEVGPAGIPALHTAPQNARLGAYGVTLRLVSSGTIPSFGPNATARSAPPGQRLFAFVLDFFPGDEGSVPLHTLAIGVSVDGASPRPLHLSDDSLSVNQFVVVAVASNATSIDLVLKDHEVTQRMSLVDGTDRGGAIEVYRRHALEGTASNFGYAQATVDEGSGVQTSQLEIPVFDAKLRFYVNGAENHPAKRTQAYLWVDMCYHLVDLSSPRTCYGFRGSELRLSVAGAAPQVARNLGVGEHPYPVWLVPASFTNGVVTVTGSEVSADGRFRLTITKPISFAVSFPPG